jgi:hypothetical protein
MTTRFVVRLHVGDISTHATNDPGDGFPSGARLGHQAFHVENEAQRRVVNRTDHVKRLVTRGHDVSLSKGQRFEAKRGARIRNGRHDGGE